MMTLTDAYDVLRVNPGDNDALITSLLDAIPNYIEVTTGMTVSSQGEEPLVDTVSGFLLKLWYFGDHADDVALKRTIDSLLKVITIKARDVETL